MTALIKIIIFFFLLTQFDYFSQEGDAIPSTICLGVAIVLLLQMIVSLFKASNGTYIYPDNNNWFSEWFYGSSQNYRSYSGNDWQNTPHHAKYCPTAIPYDPNAVKKKLKIGAAITVLEESVDDQYVKTQKAKEAKRTVVVNTTPPKQSVPTVVTATAKNYEPIVIFNEVQTNKLVESIYTAIGQCLMVRINDSQKLYYALESIYHVKITPTGAKIYYHKFFLDNFGFQLPFDELIKCIRFKLDDKTADIVFEELKQKTLIEHYFKKLIITHKE